ncbi:hypothetical protein HNR74_004023 [Flammeovirga kamogawensis]|nr:hypothetical protein [Flammeovirga kamogawensis]
MNYKFNVGKKLLINLLAVPYLDKLNFFKNHYNRMEYSKLEK